MSLFDNRWLYIGWISDDWGRAFQVQVSLWRRKHDDLLADLSDPEKWR